MTARIVSSLLEARSILRRSGQCAALVTAFWTVACGSNKQAGPPPLPPAPDDHQLHTTVIPESGGSHVQIVGRAVSLKDFVPASWSFLPVVGALDVAVDLHVPGHDGQLDYRG